MTLKLPDYTAVCFRCHKLFPITTQGQKNAIARRRRVFCSEGCMAAAGRRKLPSKAREALCYACGTSFPLTPNGLGNLRRGSRVFCSKRCRDRSRPPRQYKLRCRHCHRHFKAPYPSKIYCSRNCYFEHVRHRLTCPICGLSFKYKIGRITCSYTCSAKHKRNTKTKDWLNVPLDIPLHLSHYQDHDLLPCPYCAWIGPDLLKHAQDMHKIEPALLLELLGAPSPSYKEILSALKSHIKPTKTTLPIKEAAMQDWARSQYTKEMVEAAAGKLKRSRGTVRAEAEAKPI